jgi:DNA-binding CsgD family transcriptional regulator
MNICNLCLLWKLERLLTTDEIARILNVTRHAADK